MSLVLLGWNLCGLVVIIVWTVVLSGIVFVILHQFNILRVSAEVETKGNRDFEVTSIANHRFQA